MMVVVLLIVTDGGGSGDGGSALVKLSFLSRCLERLARSLVYLP